MDKVPKGWKPFKILIALDVPHDSDSYHGVGVERLKSLPSGAALLVDEEYYKLLVSTVCNN